MRKNLITKLKEVMRQRISLGLSLLAVLILLILAREVYLAIPQVDMTTQDIFYSYLEGRRLREGKNPYARVLEGDMRENQKYATYFPVFYELSYASQMWGFRSYEKWLAFWEPIFMVFGLAVGFLIYAALAWRKLEWAGVIGAAFWLFGRWTLRIVEMGAFDFIPIFLALLALVLFPRRKWLALFLFSLSLGFKQIAIFISPLFLVWTWQEAEKNRLLKTFLAGLLIASVPLLSGLPFLVWNWEGFIKSILFSATRLSSAQLGGPSVDAYLGWEGLSARLVMLALLAAAYWLAWRKQGGKFLLALLTMSVFIDFNSVLYSQYPAWIVPLIPLLFLDWKTSQTDEKAPG